MYDNIHAPFPNLSIIDEMDMCGDINWKYRNLKDYLVLNIVFNRLTAVPIYTIRC